MRSCKERLMAEHPHTGTRTHSFPTCTHSPTRSLTHKLLNLLLLSKWKKTAGLVYSYTAEDLKGKPGRHFLAAARQEGKSFEHDGPKSPSQICSWP